MQLSHIIRDRSIPIICLASSRTLPDNNRCRGFISAQRARSVGESDCLECYWARITIREHLSHRICTTFSSDINWCWWVRLISLGTEMATSIRHGNQRLDRGDYRLWTASRWRLWLRVYILDRNWLHCLSLQAYLLDPGTHLHLQSESC
jgi:hypothetical protein